MLISKNSKIGFIEKSKKARKIAVGKDNAFKSVSKNKKTINGKEIFNIQALEQPLFFLQEIQSTNGDDRLLEKSKELLSLLDQYRVSILLDEVDVEKLRGIMNMIKEVRGGEYSSHISSIISRIETLVAVELARVSLKNR